jgi:hypothetical protein
MRRYEKLLAELAAALRAKSEAKKEWSARRADALEARGMYNEKVALVEEIQEEIETGSTGRPLIDQMEAKQNPDPSPPATPPPPKTVAKKTKGAKPVKLAGLEFPSTRAIMDGLIAGEPATAPPGPSAAPVDQSHAAPAADAPRSKLGQFSANGSSLITPKQILDMVERQESPEDRRPITRRPGGKGGP